MALEESLRSISLPAAGDLSSSQYLFGKINSSGQVAVCPDGGKADGVIQNDPAAAGRAVQLGIAGRSKIVAGGVVGAGDSVSCDASGRAVSVASGDYSLGTAVEAASAAGDVISIIFQPSNLN